jgi:hypothetical protein
MRIHTIASSSMTTTGSGKPAFRLYLILLEATIDYTQGLHVIVVFGYADSVAILRFRSSLTA